MLKQQGCHNRGDINNVATSGSKQMSITTGPQQHQNANNNMSAKNRKDASHYTDINKN